MTRFGTGWLLATLAVLVMSMSVMVSNSPASAESFHTISLLERSAADTQKDVVKYYVVVRNEDGNPEFLFQLAERFLGDGNRFIEIFELNEGRVQPDGSALTDPDVVEAGWILLMPADAEGQGIQIGPLPTTDSDAQDTSTPAPGEKAPEPDDGSVAWLLPIAFGSLVILLVAGVVVLVLLRRRRRARRAVPFDDSLLRSDTSASWTVDRALRVLMASCDTSQLPVPQVIAVFIEGSMMRLGLVSPAAPAPGPWTASDDGQSWSAPIARLQSASTSDGSMTGFSRLVTLGVDAYGRVLLDFARARGPIILEGPSHVQHEILRRWLGELTGNPWSEDGRIVMIGNGLPQPGDAEKLSNLEQIVPELQTEGRGVLVLSEAPSSQQQALLASRFASPRFGWLVIVLTGLPIARWRFSVDDTGVLRSNVLPDIRVIDRPSRRRSSA